MKTKFILPLLAGTLFAGCSQNDDAVSDAARSREIAFQSIVCPSQTRAEHDPAVFTNENLSVWAWEDGKDTPYMDEVTVTGAGVVSGTYYWPAFALDFAAVSPAGDSHIAVSRTNGESSVSFTFSTDTPNDNATNLMYADFVNAQNGGSNPTVSLLFRHVLARLNMSVGQKSVTLPTGISNYEVTVNSVKISGIKQYGTLTVDTSYNAKADHYWTASETSGSASWTVVENQSLANGNFTTTKPYYVMPQALGDDVVLTVDFSVATTFTANNLTTTADYEKSIALNTIGLSHTNPAPGYTAGGIGWATNKDITYSIVIDPTEPLEAVDFSVIEEEWGTLSGATTVDNNYKFVDLGLPSGTKWAIHNIGANYPEEVGDYFAWGETEVKGNYTWATYKWCNGTENSLSKYCTVSNFGIVDNKTTLDLADDVARAKWRGKWRMPTKADIEELIECCWFAETTVNGVYGSWVSGPNGNGFFLPATSFVNGTGPMNSSALYYWSAEIVNNASNRANYAWILYSEGSSAYLTSNARFCGQCVRPVCD